MKKIILTLSLFIFANSSYAQDANEENNNIENQKAVQEFPGIDDTITPAEETISEVVKVKKIVMKLRKGAEAICKKTDKKCLEQKAAEKVEELLTGEEVAASETITKAILMFPKAIFRECQKLLYWIVRLIIVLILGSIFVPLAPFMSFGLNAWMMGLEYADYAMDNNKLSFSEAKRRLSRNRSNSFGFGTFVMIGTMIPIVNLIIMPAAVCGGTALWVEKLKHS